MAGINFKALTQFQAFDWERFSIGKRYVFVRADLLRVEQGEGNFVPVGTKLFVEIDQDKTEYRANRTTGELPTNEGVLFATKIMGVSPSAYENCIKHQTEIRFGDLQKAVIYGEFSNELSVTFGEAFPVE